MGSSSLPVTGIRNIFLGAFTGLFRIFRLYPFDSAFSSATVKLRRELSHRELPDGKLPAPAIIVSFGVAAALETPETG